MKKRILSPTPRWVAGSLAALLLNVAGALAATIALDTQAPLTGNQNFDGSLGMDFDVLAPISVTHLGCFDSAQNGLSRPIRVYIYDRLTQAAVAGPLTLNGTDDPLVNGSRFQQLPSPVLLNGGGSYSVVAENYGPGEPLRNGGVSVSPYSTINTDGGRLQFVGSGRYGGQGAYPGTADAGPANRYHAGTFQFESAPGPVIISSPGNQTVLEGQGVVFNVAASGSEPLSYRWQFNGSDIPGETGEAMEIAAAQIANGGVYRALVTDSSGATVVGPPFSLVVAPEIAEVIYDPSTIVGAGANGYAPGVGLFFRVVDGTSVDVTELGTTLHEENLSGQLTVQMFNSDTATVLASVVFNPGDAPQPVASTPALNLYRKSLDEILTLGPGNYAIVLYGSDLTMRYANTPAGLSVRGGGAIEHVTSRYATGAGGPGSLPTGQDGFLVYGGPTFVAQVTGKPVIRTQPVGGTFAPGATVNLSVAAAGSNPLRYQWKRNGTALDGANGPVYTIAGLGSLAAGDYSVEVSNDFGVVTSATATVNVSGAPVVTAALHTAITIAGTVGLHYQIEYRTDLDNADTWHLLQDIPSLPGSPYVYFDPTPASSPRRFYRAVLLP